MSAARTERLLNLLTLLLNTRRPISLRELREHPEFDAYCSVDPKSGERAFERDKASLIELGVPLRWIAPEHDDDCDTDGLGGYLVDREKYYLPDLDLSPEEIALLSIAGAAALGIEHFPGRHAVTCALAKIGFGTHDADGTPTEVVHSPVQPGSDPIRVRDNLEVLHDAVARRHRVRVIYEGLKDATGEQRDIDPYGLYYRQGAWYVVGHCHLRKCMRTFHLGRMATITLAVRKTKTTQQPDFKVPVDFDLATFGKSRPWEYPVTDPVNVTVRIADRLVPAIAEIFGPLATREKFHGSTIVRISVTNPSALYTALLPYGAGAEILQPKALRQQMGTLYRQLAVRYGATT